MTPVQPLHFPDRPLRVQPPGTGAAAGFGTLLWALLICAGIGWLVLPPVRDLIDDYSLNGSLQPVEHSSVDGRCSTWAGLIVRCDATLGAPAPGGGRYSRKVDYFFVELLHTGDWSVTVVADPARPPPADQAGHRSGPGGAVRRAGPPGRRRGAKRSTPTLSATAVAAWAIPPTAPVA